MQEKIPEFLSAAKKVGNSRFDKNQLVRLDPVAASPKVLGFGDSDWSDYGAELEALAITPKGDSGSAFGTRAAGN